jgi:hypothetical protein
MRSMFLFEKNKVDFRFIGKSMLELMSNILEALFFR